MAAPARPALIFLRRGIAAAVGALAALAALYLLSAWIGSSIPRNPDWHEPDSGVEIMVGDNGIHTEIVLPLVNGVKDWRGQFPAQDIADPARPYTHVAIGWGEREVFLNTPTWADLSLSTAIRAAVAGRGLLHVAHYVRPAPGTDNRPLRLSRQQYARLVAAIESQILAPNRRASYPGYFGNDVFYDAPGTYSWRKTCNQWTSDILAAAGIRTGTWTPLSGGVMKWVPLPPPAAD